MIQSFINRFKNAFDNWDLTIKTSQYKDISGGFSYKCNKTHYLKEGKTYEIEGNVYLIQSIKNNVVEFLFYGAHNIVLGSEFELIKPKLFHGTLIATNNELQEIQNWRDKLPLVYVYEILTETRNRNKLEQTEVSANVRIFFLDTTPDGQLHTDTIYQSLISYQDDLCECFLDYLYNSNYTNQIGTYEITPLTHFGTITNNGVSNSYFTDVLSGLELQINLEFKKVLNCNC